ncbi:hypothetical protein [Segatella paludivivens]|nr:hypothetical protein [Segatella paludivivens]
MGYIIKNINEINDVKTSHGAGIKHGIKAFTDCKLITIGCAV